MPEERRTYQRKGQQIASSLEYAHVQPHASEVEKAVLGAVVALSEFENFISSFASHHRAFNTCHDSLPPL